MEGFRTVTIIGKRNTYEVLYVKYFLEWLGIECVAVTEKEDVDKNSDIVCVFGNTRKWEDTRLTVNSKQDATKILKEVVISFCEINEDLKVMELLRNIYEEYHLVEIFYSYACLT